MKYAAFTSLWILTGIFSFAQPAPARELDSLFSIYDKHQLFFVNALVMRGDTILYQRSAGFQNLETGVRNHAQTRFLIGSITKSYTAAMIMQLAEEGRLRLEDKLSAFYPAIPNAGRITLEMMLRHRSGLFNYTAESDFFNGVGLPVSKAQLLERFEKLKTNFDPDVKFEYSNTNYMLLGFIIEKITGDTYENQLTQRILTRLGTKSTTLGRPDNKNDFAKSYLYNGETWVPSQPEWNTDWAAGAGAISATAADVGLFYKGLFSGKIVSPASLERMTAMKDGCGLGLMAFPFGKRTFYGHGGSIESYRSAAGYNPEDGMLLVQLLNAQKQFDPNDISVQLLNAAYGIPVKYPDLTVKPEVPVSGEKLTDYEGLYAAPGFPLEIKLFVKDGRLFGQATGQGSFPLKAISENRFVFEAANIEIAFFEKEGRTAFHFSQKTIRFDFVKKP